jgi:LuxR family transcriptional regulator, maltose regulon positive regulatory protein
MSVTTFRHHRPPVPALGAGLAEPANQERGSAQMPSSLVALRMAQDPQAAAHALSPGLDDSASAMVLRGWLVQSLLLEAIARDAFGDAAASEQALERALDLAEHDRALAPFVVEPVPALLERHARGGTAHADLISEVFNLLAGVEAASPIHGSQSLREPLTESESRVLRYLPTNLCKQEIGDELYLSVNTIKTHVKHIYAKLDVQTRRQAVERARTLGLLAHSSRHRWASTRPAGSGVHAQ